MVFDQEMKQGEELHNQKMRFAEEEHRQTMQQKQQVASQAKAQAGAQNPGKQGEK